MSVYEIINPSDAYTMVAENDDIARAAIILLGEGAYGGIKENDDKFSVPMMMFCRDAQKAVDEEFSTYGGFGPYIAGHRSELASALASVLIGGFSERRLVEDALSRMSEVDQKQWLSNRHNRLRSSMNDIGKRAWQLAEAVRKVPRDEQRE